VANTIIGGLTMEGVEESVSANEACQVLLLRDEGRKVRAPVLLLDLVRARQ
jgi:hypothetical protein